MDTEHIENETAAASRVGMELIQPTPHGEIRSRANTMYPRLKQQLPECAVLALDCLSLLRELGEAAMRETELKCTIAVLRSALVGLVGADAGPELDTMEMLLRQAQVPNSDKVGMINAFDAIRQTKGNV